MHACAGMDRRLSPEQEALSVMMSHFIENSVYYGLFYHRWIQPQVLLSQKASESSCLCCEALHLDRQCSKVFLWCAPAGG